MMQYCSIINSS